MQVIAHRGASKDALENTLEAFELAIEQGADMIETDLHLLRDGAIALYHDDELGGVAVGELTFAELRKRLPRAPTLQETLDRFAARIPFNLEIKSPRAGDYPGLEELMLAEVRRRGILVVNGPFDRQSDESYRGMSVFACDPAEAARLSDADPAVIAGRLAYDVMEWWVAAGTLAFPRAERPVGDRRSMPDD